MVGRHTWTSGGKLELEKCFFYLLHWVFDKEGIPRLATPEEMDVAITIRNPETDKRVKIEHKSCYEPHKTLGAMECPALEYRAEADRILAKCQEFAAKLADKELSMADFHVVHNTFYLPKVAYSLPTCQLPIKELRRVQRPAVHKFLTAFGFSKSTPTEITFAPSEIGGIGIRDLVVEQGCGQCTLLMGHLRCGGTPADTARQAINWMQLYAGTTFPILEEPHRALPYLPVNMLSQLREFLADSNMQLFVENAHRVELRRENDAAIMELAMKQHWTALALKRINQCRRWLQVECLSDLSDATGKRLLGYSQSSSPYDWPNAVEPGPLAWRAWNRFLEELGGTDSQLPQPLGAWKHQVNTWLSLYDPLSDSIAIHHSDGKWLYYPVVKKTRLHIQRHGKPTCSDSKPAEGIPVDQFYGRPNLFTVPSATVKLPQAPPPRLDGSWEAFVETVPLWEQDLLSNVTVDYEIEPDFLALMLDASAEILAVSDGGTKKAHGYFGWVIGTADSVVCFGRGTAHGGPRSSFRSEAYGRLALLVFLNRFHEFFFGTDNRKLPIIKCYCDNDGVIRNEDKFGFHQWSPTSSMRPDYDVLAQLQITWEQCPFPISITHIKGHQDNSKAFHELSRTAQLNVLADAQATLQREELEAKYGHTPAPFIRLPTAKCQLSHGDRPICGKEKYYLRLCYPIIRLAEYYKRKFDWSQKEVDSMAWDMFRKARKAASPGLQRFHTKLSIGRLATNDWMHKFYGTEPYCPSCLELESVHHVFQCQCKKRTEWRTQFLEGLKTHLKENLTPEDTAAVLHEGIENALDSNGIFDLQYSSSGKLNFWDLLCGRVHSKLINFMDQHLSQQETRITGEIWGKRLCLYFWNQMFKAWKLRNEDQHDSEDRRKSKFTRARAEMKIRKLYEDKPHVLAYDRRAIFGRDIEELLRSPADALEDWITTYEPMIEKAKQNCTDHHKTGSQDIRMYFSKDWRPP